MAIKAIHIQVFDASVKEKFMPFKKLLINIKKNVKHALFLGAGASIESGGLSADAIADNILTDVYSITNPDKARNQFSKEFDRPATFENVLEAFSTGSSSRRNIIISFLKKMTPSDGYRHLATLLKGGLFYPIVFTTNYDTMLEQAIREEPFIKESYNLKVLVHSDVDSEYLQPGDNEILIIKLHGDISREDTLKVTTSQASVLPDTIRKLLHRIIEQHGLIVIGYRARDIGIRNAIQDAPPTKKGVYWITKDKLTEKNDSDVLALLQRHSSSQNVLSDITFDSVFSSLGKPYTSCNFRRHNRERLDEAWFKVDRLRSFGSERQDLLLNLENLAKELMRDCPTGESIALHEIIAYECDRSGETYRLQQSVLLLEKAIEQYKYYLKPDAIISVQLAYLNELLNLFFVGNYNPNERLQHLDKLVETAQGILTNVDDNDTLTKARVLVSLGEAFKEKAMIIQDPDDYRSVIMKARHNCEQAISALRGNESEKGKYLLGAAYRHTAVTFELEADTKTGEERKKLYDEWSRYSSKAIELLESISEDCVRGYALMNLASSYCRLQEFEVSPTRKQSYLDTGIDNLNKSIDLMKRVQDNRGIGWGYIHLCELTRKKIDMQIDQAEIDTQFAHLESIANKAVASLKLIDDHLATGLAYEQLGIALYKAYKNHSDSENFIKLKQAMYVLRKGTENLMNASFYRCTGEAHLWFAKCLQELWDISNDDEKTAYIQEAIRSLINGILITSLGLKKDLKYLYDNLNTELNNILSD